MEKKDGKVPVRKNAFSLLKPASSKKINESKRIREKLLKQEYSIKKISHPTKAYENHFGEIYVVPVGQDIKEESEKIKSYLGCTHCGNYLFVINFIILPYLGTLIIIKYFVVSTSNQFLYCHNWAK